MASSSGPRRFLSTAWSLIRDAAAGSDAERERAWTRLVAVYWRPVYWKFRLDWKETPEDARDLAQDYFGMLLEKGLLDAADPAQGRFRSYIKATLANFMRSRKRAGRTLKRGGGRTILALEDLASVEAAGPAPTASPEAAFERELMRSLIDEALAKLESRCVREGRADHFRLFHTFYVERGRAGDSGYEQLQERFGLTAHEVKNRLARQRLAFRRLVLDALRDGVSTEAELMNELREVFGP